MAQLDSASDSDSDGWRFESVWVRHTKTFAFCKGLFLLTKRIQYLLLTRLTLRVTIAITLTLLATSPPYAPFDFGLCINRYYARFAHYESVWVRHSKTHAKGAYKTPMRVSFSMQNRGKLPFCGNLPFCRFFAHRRRDLFFTRFEKSQAFNDCTKRIFAR